MEEVILSDLMRYLRTEMEQSKRLCNDAKERGKFNEANAWGHSYLALYHTLIKCEDLWSLQNKEQ